MIPLLPRKRLSDLLAEMNLLDVQLQIIAHEAGAHHVRNVGQRIAELHRRLDNLECDLRLRAQHVSSDPGLPVSELRRGLGRMTDRRELQLDSAPGGFERRQIPRRSSDQGLGWLSASSF